jgi:hydrogenase 3 maturation protease
LKNLAPRDDARIAIIGIGAELNGDDAVGLITARKLSQTLRQRENVLVLEGGTLPESTSGPLRRFKPDLVIFIDAAELGKSPGVIEVVAPERIGGAYFSTHSMPLNLMMDYLSGELNCEMLLIGVQPEAVVFGMPVSEKGKKAAASLAAELSRRIPD